MLRTNLRPLLIGAAVGLVLGVLVGMLLFWVAWPVQWTDAHSYDLALEAKADYVTLVTDAAKVDRDYTRAARALDQWTVAERQQAFADAAKAYEEAGLTDKAQDVRDLGLILQVPESQPTSTPPTTGLIDRLREPCLVFVLVLLALVLAALAWRFWTRRRSANAQIFPEETAQAVKPKVEAGVAEEIGSASATGHWITTYKMGESAYDESFPIETETGEYLGECGVGISELLDSPERVTAFEVWLFDKSDIRTLTKVLLSEHAFRDEALRAKLAAKGEIMLAEIGKPFDLDTSNMQIRAQVTELEYAEEDELPNAVFSKLTIELMLEAKQEAAGPETPK